MKKLRRILVWVCVLTVGVMVSLFLHDTVVVPSVEQWSQSHALSAALSNARSVTFVEFTILFEEVQPDQLSRREVVLQRFNATAAQIEGLRAATSDFLVYRTSYKIAMCFMPHHRVEMVRQDGSAFCLEICFHCDNFRFGTRGERPIPDAWLPRLRDFFIGLGMPPRADEEYQRLAETKSRI